MSEIVILPVASSVLMPVLANDPPPGVGPYTITDVVPNRSFKVVRNKDWTERFGTTSVIVYGPTPRRRVVRQHRHQDR